MYEIFSLKNNFLINSNYLLSMLLLKMFLNKSQESFKPPRVPKVRPDGHPVHVVLVSEEMNRRGIKASFWNTLVS
jgi:hypothetical protein